MPVFFPCTKTCSSLALLALTSEAPCCEQRWNKISMKKCNSHSCDAQRSSQMLSVQTWHADADISQMATWAGSQEWRSQQNLLQSESTMMRGTLLEFLFEHKIQNLISSSFPQNHATRWKVHKKVLNVCHHQLVRQTVNWWCEEAAAQKKREA